MRCIPVQFISAAIAFCLVGDAAAHGPQMQITNDAGKIVTRSIFSDAPYEKLTLPRSVYVMPLREYNGAWYSRPNGAIDPVLGLPVYYSGPGLAYGHDQVAGGTRLFEPGSQFSLSFTDGLKRWDGSMFTDAGLEEVQAFRGLPNNPSAVAVTSDLPPHASLTFPTIPADYEADAHNTARFRLLGDGVDPLIAGDDGVYLVSLSLSSTQAGLAASDEFYFVLHKNAAVSQVAAAVSSLGVERGLVQIVPEPSSFALTACAALAAMAGLRNHHKRQEQVR